jgi:hypothetical protein
MQRDLTITIYSGFFIGDISASTILRNEPAQFQETLQQWISFKTLKRCYRASEDGWHSHVFHLHCGEVGKTVTLIKVGKYIFGGYSDQAWGNGKCYNVTEARDVLIIAIIIIIMRFIMKRFPLSPSQLIVRPAIHTRGKESISKV